MALLTGGVGVEQGLATNKTGFFLPTERSKQLGLPAIRPRRQGIHFLAEQLYRHKTMAKVVLPRPRPGGLAQYPQSYSFLNQG